MRTRDMFCAGRVRSLSFILSIPTHLVAGMDGPPSPILAMPRRACAACSFLRCTPTWLLIVCDIPCASILSIVFLGDWAHRDSTALARKGV